MSSRPDVSTPDLDAAELAWWQRFAELEDHYCWVQTPAIQRFIRRTFLAKVREVVADGARVVELGCGSGWLPVLLARTGASVVCGYDFSPAQIERARARAEAAGVAEKVFFEVVGDEDLHRRAEFDVVILHAFLHHLTKTEIARVVHDARRLLRPGGRLLVFEPVAYPPSPTQSTGMQDLRRLEWLMRLPSRGRRWRVRRMSAGEADLRKQIDSRYAATPPFGPAPKEIPFGPDELPTLLAGEFVVVDRTRCMSMSHLVAQELLLMEVTHRFTGPLVRWPILWAARRIDERMVGAATPPPGVWIFELFECVPAEG